MTTVFRYVVDQKIVTYKKPDKLDSILEDDTDTNG